MSVVTHVRCDGKHDKNVIANVMLNSTGKQFWCQSYAWDDSGVFVLTYTVNAVKRYVLQSSVVTF